MITIATLLLLASPLTSAAASLELTSYPMTAAVSVQDDEEKKPDKREEIKLALKEFKDHIGARGKEDPQAIAIIDTLLQEFPESGPKDRKAIVKGLSGALKVTRKATKEGVVDNKIYIAAAAALGRMGPESVKPLMSAMGHKNFAKDYVGKRAVILALGSTKDEDGVGDLTDLLSHHEPQVQAAAAEALGNFSGADSKVRKEIFKEILNQISQVKNALDVDPTDPIVRQRYDGIAGPMLRALQDLSAHEESDPMAYRSWWNDNKKRDWDELEKGKDA